MAAASGADDELAAGRIVAGRYRVEGLLGSGGMGRVYRAVDEQLGRAVALKLLAVAADGSLSPEDASRRLLREARAAAAFAHPNAVAVFDVGEHEGRPFIAMELVRGRTLRDAIGDTTVPVDQRLRWLGDVARALGAAHRAGLVHRDVKPDNVIVADDGTVKLLDFGIARRLPGPIDGAAATERDGTITVEGTLVGTPAYMAPEQLRAERVDGRADQFAWAVMAYELLAGERPWAARGAAELIAAVLSKPAPPLSVAGLPPSVAPAVARALSKLAGDRFATMEALVAALHAAPPSRGVAPPLRALAVAAAAAVTLAVVAAVWIARRPTAIATPTPAPTSPSLRNALSPAPLRGLCPDPSKVTPCSRDGEVPWCDREGRFLACCAKELAALGSDGMCGCPKGGSTAGGSCPASLHSKSEYGRSYLLGVTRKAVERCGPASEQLGYLLEVDPDGRIFNATIHAGATADVELQRCVIDALRQVEVDPPPNGSFSIGYGPLYPHY